MMDWADHLPKGTRRSIAHAIHLDFMLSGLGDEQAGRLAMLTVWRAKRTKRAPLPLARLAVNALKGSRQAMKALGFEVVMPTLPPYDSEETERIRAQVVDTFEARWNHRRYPRPRPTVSSHDYMSDKAAVLYMEHNPHLLPPGATLDELRQDPPRLARAITRARRLLKDDHAKRQAAGWHKEVFEGWDDEGRHWRFSNLVDPDGAVVAQSPSCSCGASLARHREAQARLGQRLVEVIGECEVSAQVYFELGNPVRPQGRGLSDETVAFLERHLSDLLPSDAGGLSLRGKARYLWEQWGVFLSPDTIKSYE